VMVSSLWVALDVRIRYDDSQSTGKVIC